MITCWYLCLDHASKTISFAYAVFQKICLSGQQSDLKPNGQLICCSSLNLGYQSLIDFLADLWCSFSDHIDVSTNLCK